MLVGPDRYLVDVELRRLLSELDPDGLNTTRFDRSADLSEVAAAVATVGFFGTGRVIVAEGLLARATGKAKGSDLGAVVAVLTAVAPDNSLILIDPEVGTVPKAVKDACPGRANDYIGSVPRGGELIRWTKTAAKGLGGTIEPRAAQELLSRLFPGSWSRAQNPPYDKTPDLAILMRTLETLVLYAGDQQITSSEVDVMVRTESSDQMFAFTDSVFAGDTAGSLTLLHKEGVDDDSAAKLLSYSGTQSELALIVSAVNDRENMAALGKELGNVSEGRLARLQKVAGRGTAFSISTDVAAADRRLKTGKIRGVQSQLFDLLISRAQKERGR